MAKMLSDNPATTTKVTQDKRTFLGVLLGGFEFSRCSDMPAKGLIERKISFYTPFGEGATGEGG